jgi:hypothetical protein
MRNVGDRLKKVEKRGNEVGAELKSNNGNRDERHGLVMRILGTLMISRMRP